MIKSTDCKNNMLGAARIAFNTLDFRHLCVDSNGFEVTMKNAQEQEMLAAKLVLAVAWVLTYTIDGLQAGGDATKGKYLTQQCGMGNGEDSKGNDQIPALVKFSKAIFIEQLIAFEPGERVDETELMRMCATQPKDQDMVDLAAYLKTLDAD